MKKAWMICLLLLVLVMPAAAQDNVPRFEPSDCGFNIPTGQEPECGYLVVPENRNNPASPTIQLAVAIFHSPNPNKAPEPVVYLEGGPGGNALATASLQFDTFFAPFVQNNDLILFDQRGVGLSKPALDCKETTDFSYETLDQEFSADEYVQQYGDTLKACAQRLIGQGVDLTGYNSAESAADINDMRAALGYDKLNLFGISYGTRLALTVLRDHPEAVRSAIIDSVVPLQGSYFDAGKTTERVLNKLFEGCAANTACNEAYPDLENVFYDLVKQFNSQPITVPVPNLRAGGQQINAVVDGDGLIGTFFQAFYLTDLIPTLPQSIYDIKNGDFNLLSTITTLALLQLNFVSSGMYMAVQCEEEMPFENAASVNALLDTARPELRGFLRRQLVDPATFDVCAAWNKDAPNPIENQPVVSDIPTLVFGGEYDPVTPPEYAQLAAQTLSKGYFFEFPGTGHAVIPSSECALQMALAFLANPQTSPDAACLAGVKAPNFVVPGMVAETAAITLIPFSNETMNISGIVPDGWKELIPGTFSRAESGIDQTAIAYQVIPGANVEMALPLLSGQFGVTDTAGTTREANGLTWRLVQGEFGGVKVDMALANDSAGVYMIIFLTNNDAEREALYNVVFLPAIDALKPGA